MNTEQLPGKLRLLLVTPLFPPAVGGASEDFRLLAQAWQGFESVEQIVILTERRGGSAAREVKGKVIVLRVIPMTGRTNKRAGPIYVAKRLWMYALLVATVAWHQIMRRSDVVLVHGRYGRKDFLRVLKLIGARVVVFLSDHFRPPENLAVCDAIICVTESVYKRAESTLPDAHRLYYAPFPFERPRIPPRKTYADDLRTPYFLFLGDVSRWKGADVLLEAFAAFRQDHPQFHLYLAGPLCDVNLVEGYREGATFLGEVAHGRALDLIQGAEVLVLPSRSEGLPRVCLEAIALGTKVICPPGVPELQRACPDWILSSITPGDLLEKLKQVADSDFRSSFRFETYDPDMVGQRVLEICSAISRNSSTPFERERDDVLPRSAS